MNSAWLSLTNNSTNVCSFTELSKAAGFLRSSEMINKRLGTDCISTFKDDTLCKIILLPMRTSGYVYCACVFVQTEPDFMDDRRQDTDQIQGDY